MDFSKLNIEFANMQTTIKKYNDVINLINNKIKNNEKEISKYETKNKNSKNILEKDSLKIIVDSIKQENIFLKTLLIDKNNKEMEKQLWTIKNLN